MIQQLLQMLLDGRIVAALEQGYDAVLSVFADLADSWLRAMCPAYALAMDGAETLAPYKIKALRLAAVKEVVDQLGLGPIIRSIIDQWMKAPSTVREAARLYASAGKDFRQVWSDPSISNIADLVVNRLPDAYKFTEHVLLDVAKGNLGTAQTTGWVLGFADTANEQVVNLLRKWKLGPVADAVSKYGAPVTAMAKDSIMIPADAVDSAWRNIATGDPVGILKDVLGVSALETGVALVASIGKEAVKLGEDIVEGGVSIVKAATSPRTAAAIATLGLSELF